MDDMPSAAILVAGTGPAGLSAALAFAQAGFAVTLVGPPPSEEDRRTTALMIPAIGFLTRLGIELGDAAAPLEAMRIVDATGRLIRSRTVTFRAAEIGENYFGLNVPNASLLSALAAGVRSERGIDWRPSLVASWRSRAERVTATLSDGSIAQACLAVAADGRASSAREAAGIAVRTRAHPQAALVLTFSHSRGHGGMSTEFHTENGPVTQVPLPGNRSSLVWVASLPEADALTALDDDALARRVEDKLQSILGAVTVEPGRQIYPLSTGHASRLSANRIALVGEAAHLIPPIGAQGLNLGLKDVAELVEVATENRLDPGSTVSLASYQRRRAPDVMARSAAVALLNRSLLSDLLPAQLARSTVLGLLARIGPLRTVFMREGLKPGSSLGDILSKSKPL